MWMDIHPLGQMFSGFGALLLPMWLLVTCCLSFGLLRVVLRCSRVLIPRAVVAAAPAVPAPVPAPVGMTFEGSTVLSHVQFFLRHAFVDRINTRWLPGAGPSVLLFRMSRDGESTRSFHYRCDGKASTVVLIRSNDGFVFGGYAGKAWDSSGAYLRCPRSFIFTVSNPHGITPTRYLVKKPQYALQGNSAYGPVFGGGIFGGGLYVGDGNGVLTSGGKTLFSGYTDTTRKGRETFTGAWFGGFTPAEVEVWQV